MYILVLPGCKLRYTDQGLCASNSNDLVEFMRSGVEQAQGGEEGCQSLPSANTAVAPGNRRPSR